MSPDQNWHVLYRAHLRRILAGQAGCVPAEEIADAEALKAADDAAFAAVQNEERAA
jgi:hypothetical protein